jgi:hypothetical protein
MYLAAPMKNVILIAGEIFDTADYYAISTEDAAEIVERTMDGSQPPGLIPRALILVDSWEGQDLRHDSE